MRHWPDSLPGPIGPGFSLQPADPFLRTEFEVGAGRNRRLTRARRDLVTGVWRFTAAEFEAFRAWFEDLSWSLAGHSTTLAHWWGVRMNWIEGISLGPDGVVSGGLRETAEFGSHWLGPDVTGLGNGASAHVIVTLRPVGRTVARVGLLGRDGVQRWAEIDLSTGVVTNSLELQSVSVTSRGAGWRRIVITATVATGVGPVRARVQTMDGPSGIQFDGVPQLGLDIAEFNVLPATQPPVYLPTQSDGRVNGADGGGAWALVPVWTGSGPQTRRECRFTAPFSVQVLPGLNTEVTAPMEVRHA